MLWLIRDFDLLSSSASHEYHRLQHWETPHLGDTKFFLCDVGTGRYQWPRGLRRRSTAARLLRLWVRIPPGAWMFVCCVLSGRSLCDGLIIRSEESYRLWRVVVCDQETSYARRLKPARGCKIQPPVGVVAPREKKRRRKKRCRNWTFMYSYVMVMVDKVPLEEAFLQVLSFSLISKILPVTHAYHLHSYS